MLVEAWPHAKRTPRLIGTNNAFGPSLARRRGSIGLADLVAAADIPRRVMCSRPEHHGMGAFRTGRGARAVGETREGDLAAMVASERGTVIKPVTVQVQIVNQIAITAAK